MVLFVASIRVIIFPYLSSNIPDVATHSLWVATSGILLDKYVPLPVQKKLPKVVVKDIHKLSYGIG